MRKLFKITPLVAFGGLCLALIVVDAIRSWQFFSAHVKTQTMIECFTREFVRKDELGNLPQINMERIDTIADQVDLIRETISEIDKKLESVLEEDKER